MPEPTLSAVQVLASWDGTGSATRATPSITWSAGDVVLVAAATEDNSATFITPTVTGLTFAAVTGSPTNSASNTKIYMWVATAAAGGSGAVTTTISPSGTTDGGIGAFAYTGSTGVGTAVAINGSSAKTISLTRTGTNSHVVVIMGDWAAVGDVVVTATPTGTVRHAQAPGGADFFLVSFGDQGAAGTTSYGITDHTGTVDMTGLVVEVFGTAGGVDVPRDPAQGLCAITGGGTSLGFRINMPDEP